ncbi:MAG: ABC transporter ATP-binding protein [Solobacterium sp.]|nr:ABC transporter ATP-binding protein [Solobacterium sp.]MBR0214661.1 ABC transporter ATP-binding protein [Solobacterium sp.]
MSEKKKDPSAIAWLLDQAGEHRRQYAVSVVLAVCGVLCSVAPYFAVAGIVRAMMAGQRDLPFYLRRCFVMAVLWLGRVLFHALSTATSHRATFAVLGEIRKRGLEKLTRMPLGDVLAESSGALKNTLIERIDAIETTLAHIVPEFTANLLVPAIMIIYIFTIDWRMGLASLLTVPLGLACYIGMMAGSAGFYERTVKATKALNSTAVEYINGIQVIKVFGKTKSSYERFAADANEAAASFVDWMRSSIIPFTFAMVIMPATMVSILPIGGLLVRGGSLAAQDFVYIIILSVGLIAPLITCMSYSDDIRTMGTIVGEVRRIVEAPEMNRPLTGTAPEENALRLEDVRFSYGDKEVLHGINMEIPEGSFTALVGPSGSGKSTIARLIASLWEADSGRIMLGGKDLRGIPLDICADRVAFVSQDNYLFNMNVRENIRLGRPDASDAEVEEAARMSGCHEFILSLENGYETMVGSSGSHLSGGERQRISIARAMLKAAPIVILDEATAYTDPENEAVIQRSVSRLTAGKTLIVIAHRLSTVRDADRIYVIKDGLVDDAGTHEELMNHHGLYETMYRAHMAARDQEVSLNG